MVEEAVVMVEVKVQGDPHINQEAAMTMTVTMANQRRQSLHPIVQGRHKVQHMTLSRNKQHLTLGVSTSLEMI